MRNIIIGLVVVGVIAYFAIYKSTGQDKAAAGTPNPAPEPPGGGDSQPQNVNGCITVGAGVKRFENAIVPPNAQAYFGYTDAAWNEATKNAIIGFFFVLDIEPSDSTMEYLGRAAFRRWMFKSESHLPYTQLVKGSLRCANQSQFIGSLYR